jgi:MscS family membrane protein
LAVRPTLENIIGGFILFADKPIRTGDFCAFGDKLGTVEEIGLRSTRLRALDRTIVTVPNAEFANMQLVNYARCDTMLILKTIGLRYETKPEQLRYVLAKLREMLLAHPKIEQDTLRVRFVGYGSSSQDIQIRVYAMTREWNEFYAIQEDVLLRVGEIVDQSGTSFAFPSQTLYVGRDQGIDEERSLEAMQEVNRWRKEGRLPFPRMAPAYRERLANTLDYPPRGSPEAFRPEGVETETAEPLSKEPEKNPEEEKREQ